MEGRGTNTGYPFPRVPEKWGRDERNFARGLRILFDMLFARKKAVFDAFPVGSVAFTTSDSPPFDFGVWEAVSTGITGLYAWERTR